MLLLLLLWLLLSLALVRLRLLLSRVLVVSRETWETAFIRNKGLLLGNLLSVSVVVVIIVMLRVVIVVSVVVVIVVVVIMASVGSLFSRAIVWVVSNSVVGSHVLVNHVTHLEALEFSLLLVVVTMELVLGELVLLLMSEIDLELFHRRVGELVSHLVVSDFGG